MQNNDIISVCKGISARHCMFQDFNGNGYKATCNVNLA